MIQLTDKERKAIAALKKLEKEWPKSLWIFSASGRLHVMKKDRDGDHAKNHTGGMDPNFIAETINIENDGGDW